MQFHSYPNKHKCEHHSDPLGNTTRICMSTTKEGNTGTTTEGSVTQPVIQVEQAPESTTECESTIVRPVCDPWLSQEMGEINKTPRTLFAIPRDA